MAVLNTQRSRSRGLDSGVTPDTPSQVNWVLSATKHHLSYGITQCYLLDHSQTGWYSIYIPQRGGRLSWL